MLNSIYRGHGNVLVDSATTSLTQDVVVRLDIIP